MSRRVLGGVVVAALALLVLVPASGSAATRKFPVTVAWTVNYENDGLFGGKVKSRKAVCRRSRIVRITPDTDVSVPPGKANQFGEFTVGFDVYDLAASADNGPSYVAKVARKRIGPGKVCKADTATLTWDVIARSVDDMTYDSEELYSYGYFSSPDERCLAEQPMVLHYSSNGSDYQALDSGLINSDGQWVFLRVLDPGYYFVQATPAFASSVFEAGGNGEIETCQVVSTDAYHYED
jgi:hypothetical protein